MRGEKPQAAIDAEAAFLDEQARRDIEKGPAGLRRDADWVEKEGGQVGRLMARCLRGRANKLELEQAAHE